MKDKSSEEQSQIEYVTMTTDEKLVLFCNDDDYHIKIHGIPNLQFLKILKSKFGVPDYCYHECKYPFGSRSIFGNSII